MDSAHNLVTGGENY